MSTFQKFALQYLNFTTREKTGIAGLLVIIVFLNYLPDILYTKKDYSKELSAFNDIIAKMEEDSIVESATYSSAHKAKANESISPFYFDPNTVNPNELKKFGVPQYVIERFTKFRKAGAKFHKKEDLKKLYGLKPEVYERMSQYIIIKEKSDLSASTEKNILFQQNKSKQQNTIELNTADSLSLLKIRGIGPYLCSKILKYRKALGGYVSLEQLNEIYNIKPEQVEAIKPFLTLDARKIVFIQINTADYLILNGHPYISGKEANSIIQYRKQHGPFGTKTDLEKVYLLSPETINKLLPYLEY